MTDERPPAAAPGWYPHPSMARTQAYWDGGQWTDHVAPLASETPERQQVTQMSSVLLKLILLGLAIAAVLFLIVIAGRIAA